MSRNATFIRKVIYGCAIVVLLFPLFLLGQPETKSIDGQGTQGGLLARMRSDYGLSQSELGEIDPASEAMRMSTLGLRGVASMMLWQKADEYKRKESWDRLSATLNQIAKLQPNMITVWEFQAHNLSYNVSSEFDNYRHRYHWVKKGIDFLMDGTQHNQRSPRLYWNLGWFCCQKIGRADEFEQFREMFRDDSEFHDRLGTFISIDDARGPDGRPDNWLVGYLWYLEARRVAGSGVPVTWLRVNPEVEGLSDTRKSTLVFYSDAPMALINHATAVTEEIIPGERTRQAWTRAGEELNRFGNREIPSTFGYSIQLNSLEPLVNEIDDLRDQLEGLGEPGLREKIRDELKLALTPEEREILERRPRNVDELTLKTRAQEKTAVTDFDLADRLPNELRNNGRRLARLIAEKLDRYDTVDSYRGTVNYPYWKTRCEAEQTVEAAEARRLLITAQERAEAGDPEGAKKLFEESWGKWAGVFENHPQLMNHIMADDLEVAIASYRLTLDQLDEDFPRDFPLNKLIERPEDFAPELPPELQQPPGAAGQPPATENADATKKDDQAKKDDATKKDDKDD